MACFTPKWLTRCCKRLFAWVFPANPLGSLVATDSTDKHRPTMDYESCTDQELRAFIKARWPESSLWSPLSRPEMVDFLRALDRDATFPLMNLPAELRILVYNQLLIDTHRTPRFHAICLASKQVNSETEPIVYKENEFGVSFEVKHGRDSPRVRLQILVNGQTEMQKTYAREHAYRSFVVWPSSLRKVYNLTLSIDFGRSPLDLTKRALNHTLLGLLTFMDALSSIKTLNVVLSNHDAVPKPEQLKILWPLAAFGRRMPDCQIILKGHHADLQAALDNSISGHSKSSSGKDLAVEQLSSTLRITARAVVRLKDASYNTLVATKIDGPVLNALAAVGYVDGRHWERIGEAEGKIKKVLEARTAMAPVELPSSEYDNKSLDELLTLLHLRGKLCRDKRSERTKKHRDIKRLRLLRKLITADELFAGFRFMDLPPELRLHVYEHLLMRPTPTAEDRDADAQRQRFGPLKVSPTRLTEEKGAAVLWPAILRVNQLIRKEATPVLYDKNEYGLNMRVQDRTLSLDTIQAGVAAHHVVRGHHVHRRVSNPLRHTPPGVLQHVSTIILRLHLPLDIRQQTSLEHVNNILLGMASWLQSHWPGLKKIDLDINSVEPSSYELIKRTMWPLSLVPRIADLTIEVEHGPPGLQAFIRSERLKRDESQDLISRYRSIDQEIQRLSEASSRAMMWDLHDEVREARAILEFRYRERSMDHRRIKRMSEKVEEFESLVGRIWRELREHGS